MDWSYSKLTKCSSTKIYLKDQPRNANWRESLVQMNSLHTTLPVYCSKLGINLSRKWANLVRRSTVQKSFPSVCTPWINSRPFPWSTRESYSAASSHDTDKELFSFLLLNKPMLCQPFFQIPITPNVSRNQTQAFAMWGNLFDVWLGNCDIDFFIFRYWFHITRPKFCEIQKRLKCCEKISKWH